jgi:hypothetical protein
LCSTGLARQRKKLLARKPVEDLHFFYKSKTFEREPSQLLEIKRLMLTRKIRQHLGASLRRTTRESGDQQKGRQLIVSGKIV